MLLFNLISCKIIASFIVFTNDLLSQGIAHTYLQRLSTHFVEVEAVRCKIQIRKDLSMCILIFISFLVIFRNCVEDFLCDMLDELPEEKKNIYMSLSDCKSECEEKTELGNFFCEIVAVGIFFFKLFYLLKKNGLKALLSRMKLLC